VRQRVAGVLLAAGGGSRLGRPKALVELGGQTLVRRGVETLTAGGAEPVLVVTGPVPLAEAGAAAGAGVIEVPNPGWRGGMGSSLRAGLLAVPAGCPAAVIALADQPLVGAVAVSRLIAAFAGGAQVAVAGYGGAPRNPVLLARRHFAAAAAAAVGDTGAREFLRARPDLVTVVECGDCGSPDDVDTEADLLRLAARTEPPGSRG
jgi:nicotine blue oxidoreductase